MQAANEFSGQTIGNIANLRKRLLIITAPYPIREPEK